MMDEKKMQYEMMMDDMKDDGDGGGDYVKLSEKFKKMMEQRIEKQQIVPVHIDPNEANPDRIVHHKTVIVEKKIDDDDYKSASPRQASPSVTSKKISSEDFEFIVPTKLHRPLILCVDSESNAWGDAKFRIPPLCYTYLTMHSRNTRKNELYAHSTNQLMADPTMSMERHQWILQSAYALGFNAEPEVTAFNRYWPHEITEDHSVRNNIFAQRKKLDFSQSIEIAKCSDFILFSPQNFRVLQLLEPLKKEWIY